MVAVLPGGSAAGAEDGVAGRAGHGRGATLRALLHAAHRLAFKHRTPGLIRVHLHSSLKLQTLVQFHLISCSQASDLRVKQYSRLLARHIRAGDGCPPTLHNSQLNILLQTRCAEDALAPLQPCGSLSWLIAETQLAEYVDLGVDLFLRGGILAFPGWG